MERHGTARLRYDDICILYVGRPSVGGRGGGVCAIACLHTYVYTHVESEKVEAGTNQGVRASVLGGSSFCIVDRGRGL